MEKFNSFIRDGYIVKKNLFDRVSCYNIHQQIKKIRKVDSSIFLNNKEYLELPKKSKFSKPKNLLNNFNLDFIFKNQSFLFYK